MAGVKFIAKCHIQWIEGSSKHGHCLQFFSVSKQLGHGRISFLTGSSCFHSDMEILRTKVEEGS